MTSFTQPFLSTNDGKCIVRGNNLDGDCSQISEDGIHLQKLRKSGVK